MIQISFCRSNEDSLHQLEVKSQDSKKWWVRYIPNDEFGVVSSQFEISTDNPNLNDAYRKSDSILVRDLFALTDLLYSPPFP